MLASIRNDWSPMLYLFISICFAVVILGPFIEDRAARRHAARIAWRKAELLHASPDWYARNPHPDAGGHPIARFVAFLALSVVFSSFGFLVCSGAFLPEPSNYGGFGFVLGSGLAWWVSGIPAHRTEKATKRAEEANQLAAETFWHDEMRRQREAKEAQQRAAAGARQREAEEVHQRQVMARAAAEKARACAARAVQQYAENARPRAL